jgi:hypothetical protein
MASGDDILKTANRLFSKIGNKVASTTRQVTGIGLGELRIVLDRTKLAPGDTLRGTVTLELTQPLDARKLTVGLRAGVRPADLANIGGLRIPGSPETPMFQAVQELAGTKTYDSAGFPFELVIPAHAHEIQTASGTVEWRVFARLDNPRGRDLDHAVEIVVEP